MAVHGGIPARHSVPLTTVAFSGNRYVAMADLGLQRPVPLMVHGNGRVFLSLTHYVAERVIGRPVEKGDDYGYTSRGRGTIEVPTMRLGSEVFEDISGVPVFDFGDEPDAPVQGMLGTRFLTASRAAVDFTEDALLLGVTVSAGPNAALVGRGYRHARMHVSEDHRVTVDAYFPVIGRDVAITPSTVSNALTLHRPFFEGRISMRRSPIPDRSPSGTSPDVYTADSVEFVLAGVECRNAATLEDLAEYATVAEAELRSYGMLGYDWMKQHRAILDYANRVLFFMP